MVYLDNAATSWPKPEAVYRAMHGFLSEKGGNPGRGSHSMAAAAAEVIEETRRLAAGLVNAPSASRVIFTLNCTDALNLALKGLLKPGDHVIMDSIGHNSLVRPLAKLVRQGVKVTRILPSAGTGVLSPSDIEGAITPDTRLIAVTHASNVTGVVQPVGSYGAVAREHGLIILVDAAQTAGRFPLDVRAMNVDLLAFSGHKGLLGPPGTGMLYIGERVDLDSVREGGTGVGSELEEQPGELPQRYESGTPNGVGISGLGAGLKHIFDTGMEKILDHDQRLNDMLIDGLRRIPGLTLHAPGEGCTQAPVISFNLSGYEPGEVEVILDHSYDIKARAGLHCAPAAHKVLGTFPAGTVRLSPGCFNTEDEMSFTIEAIARIARSRLL